MNQSKLLSVSNLSHVIGDITTIKGITFDIEPGEVLGVVGQRGSGKSTLIKLLGGSIKPSNGETYYEGKKILKITPTIAHKIGIETVFPNESLFDHLDVVQNIFSKREIYIIQWMRLWPNNQEMERIAKEFLSEIQTNPEIVSEPVHKLTNEQKQVVALARAIIRPAKLYLMDDPLAALSFERQQILINKIKELASKDSTIIISCENLKHIFAMTDRILVLYGGKQVALKRTSQTTPSEIVELIVGTHNQDQITPVIWAFERYHDAQKQAEDLRRTQLELQQNLEEQDTINQQLVFRLSEQLQALDRLNIALQQANRRLMTEREGERKALARELHDQVIQDLISYSYQLEGLGNELNNSNQRKDLARVRTGIRQVVGALRNLCSNLRPPSLDSQGLSAAIESLVHEWSEQSAINVILSVDHRLGRFTESIELSAFRIVQEGLSNVRKHANASEVILSLKRSPTASLVIKIVDDGKGSERPINFGELSKDKHFGLVGISERVSLLGGKMKVKSHPDSGLELFVEIPSSYPTIEK